MYTPLHTHPTITSPVSHTPCHTPVTHTPCHTHTLSHPKCMLGYTPCGQTDTCENITFLRLLLSTVVELSWKSHSLFRVHNLGRWCECSIIHSKWTWCGRYGRNSSNILSLELACLTHFLTNISTAYWPQIFGDYFWTPGMDIFMEQIYF